MDGANRGTPEMTVHSAAGSVGEAKQQASKEHATPGSMSQVTGADSGGAGSDPGGKPLPGWKLDCLCRESGLPPAMKGGFLCF
ncbi:hypothetical protein ACUV84_029107 [Puccinellia chinampoensis]